MPRPKMVVTKHRREKGIRTLLNEVRPCPYCKEPIEILAVRKQIKPASPGEYETDIQVRKPTQKSLDDVSAP